MTQDWKEEFNSNYPQLFVKGDEWNWQPDIVNFIEFLLKQERNTVLSACCSTCKKMLSSEDGNNI